MSYSNYDIVNIGSMMLVPDKYTHAVFFCFVFLLFMAMQCAQLERDVPYFLEIYLQVLPISGFKILIRQLLGLYWR